MKKLVCNMLNYPQSGEKRGGEKRQRRTVEAKRVGVYVCVSGYVCGRERMPVFKFTSVRIRTNHWITLGILWMTFGRIVTFCRVVFSVIKETPLSTWWKRMHINNLQSAGSNHMD